MTGARRPTPAPRPESESATLSRVGPGRWRLDGILNLTTVVPLSRQCPEADEQGRAELDLGGVRRSSSAGVALLLEWQSRLHTKGAGLHLTGVPGAVLRLAALGNVSGLLGMDAPSGRADAASGSAAAVDS